MAAAKPAKQEGLMYNGHPLRRKDNLILSDAIRSDR